MACFIIKKNKNRGGGVTVGLRGGGEKKMKINLKQMYLRTPKIVIC